MKVSKMFPTPHLKGDDLGGIEPNVKIVKIGPVKAFNSDTNQEEDKWAVWFFGKDKYLLLNKTNATMIAELLGSDESDDWVGGRVKLYSTPVQAFGATHNAVRVKKADPKKTAEEEIAELDVHYQDQGENMLPEGDEHMIEEELDAQMPF